MQYGFYFNADTCVACRTCAAACKDRNDLPIGIKIRRVYDYAGGTWSVKDGVCECAGSFAYSLSAACNHCANPACVENCPSGAMQKREEDGIVFSDNEICIACGTCSKVCPYGHPTVDGDAGFSRKCDLCKATLADGGNPACVDACVTRSLKFGDVEQLRAEFGEVSWIPPMPEDSSTGPSVVFTPSRLNPDGALPGRIINAEHEIS